ncbi:MAG: hypothetical protein E7079_01490 [Bacteroidales bacterium]|nr:hypothetical protein [Bacteroidales bacterium]
MSQTESNKSKRIIKNTGLLYIRMILVILLKLYTSRIALDVLGFTDFGIYNLVAGLIVLFSFLNSSMSGASIRFFTTAMGKSDNALFQKYYSTSICVHFIIGVIAVVLAESIGMYYFYDLNIPPERMNSAFIVYQISILFSLFEIIKSPFNANIIAHEKMSFYSYVSVLEVLMGLMTAFAIKYVTTDKLITYSALIALSGAITLTLYVVYCNRYFKEISLKIRFYKNIIIEIITFVAWSVSSSFANIFSKQAFNVLINIFYGVMLNASIAIMNQVTVAINGFVQNFQMAINPQIFKSFASNDTEYLQRLFLSSAKISFFLLWIIALPFILCMDEILNLWLTEVPPYTAAFCVISLIALMPNSIGGAIWTVIQASGNIKRYQVVICVITLLNVPCFYFLFKTIDIPYVAYISTIVSNVIIVICGFNLAKDYIKLSFVDFFRNVLNPIMRVLVIGSIIPIVFSYSNINYCSHFIQILIIGIVSILSVGSTIYLTGLSLSEKSFVCKKVKSIFHRHE